MSEEPKFLHCQHEELVFGSGGYYIFCRNCSWMWVSKEIFTDDHEHHECREGCHKYHGEIMNNSDIRRKPNG